MLLKLVGFVLVAILDRAHRKHVDMGDPFKKLEEELGG